MKRVAQTLLLAAVMLLIPTACHRIGNPYDEYEILPLEEAPAPPEAPEADAPIAAEEPDAAVSDEANLSQENEQEGVAAVTLSPRVVAQANRLKVGETFRAEIRIMQTDPVTGSESMCRDCFFRTFLNGDEYESEGGVVRYENVCTDTGTFYLQGVVYVEKPTGIEKYPYSDRYVVE